MRALLLAAACCCALVAAPARAERVQVTGEVVDSWCTISGVMFGYGSAHFQCAVWCALGGIPVSIKTPDDEWYVVLKIEDDTENVANPRIVAIQAHQVTVDGELIQRDGVNYLLVDRVADDQGIVNLTHDEYGIVPFGE